jgi:signal transduction histidine kinase
VKHSLIYTIGRAIFAYMPLKLKIFGVVLLAELVAVTAGVGLYRGDASLPFLLLLFLGTAGVFYLVAKHVLKPYDEEVNSRLKTSLERAMKAERLKTELITNVSHDLKTPLTAILNYSDLLLKEGEDNEYAQIIHEKSQKLKSLTEDLFEVSKAQSGNIQVNSEKLDVAELIRQTLAEFDELQLPFKIRLEEGCCILADGKLMSRVFENIIGNIVKYSLENTRAYIDAAAQDGEINITFKNIANYEMNFEASEMAERFARGDEARTTDGNGLGLAIAKSYTEVCGGRLEVGFDGDLFKVSLWFKAPDAPVSW